VIAERHRWTSADFLRAREADFVHRLTKAFDRWAAALGPVLSALEGFQRELLDRCYAAGMQLDRDDVAYARRAERAAARSRRNTTAGPRRPDHGRRTR
jgi:hypothetical protein